MSIQAEYSVIIPVFNSEKTVGLVESQTFEVFAKEGLSVEVVLIDDGSADESWNIISGIAKTNEKVVAVKLLRNYGQHTAMFCGIANASGNYLMTIDDDLQNPPEELLKLIAKINEGYDLVFGRFKEKKHGLHRRLGSKAIGLMNEKVFGKPKDLVLSNVRIFTDEVAQRALSYRTAQPYLQGILLQASSSFANVEIEHRERADGKSNYSLSKILKLVAVILFNYSSYPLKLVSSIGITISLVGFVIGLIYLVRGLLDQSTVPGWTSLIVVLSFFNGITLLILGMLGEYLVRVLNQINTVRPYEVKEIVNGSKA